MNITNKQNRTIILTCLIVFVLVIVITIVKNNRIDIDVSNSIHGVVNENNTSFIYKNNKLLKLNKGDRVYVLQDDILNNQYIVKYNDKVGTIDKAFVSYYEFNDFEKYSLMTDVSEFNLNNNFTSEKDFELFILNNKINYVYIRIGGRGWGQNGNLYLDDKSQIFIEACEYLKVPYGFYYLDEALIEEEADEEIEFIKTFLDDNTTSMNVLPLAIDLEYQDGKGRADNIWNKRTEILDYLITKFKSENIDCFVYVNGIRGEEFIKSLDIDFWVARYPEDGKVPESFYDFTMNYMDMKSILEQLLENDNRLKKNVDLSKEYKMRYSEEFLNKVVGWQFTESGASKDGISEKIDLSVVKNDYFKKYVKTNLLKYYLKK